MAGLTIDNPVNLKAVVESHNVLPGDTLYLLPGTYTGNYIFPINGTQENPITITNYNGGRAILDGFFRIYGDYINIVNLEITNTRWVGRENMWGESGFDCLGDYIKIINCIIHDKDQGISSSEVYTGQEYYGNLVYFNGWNSHLGHGIYPQNNLGNTKLIKHNVIFDNFGYGIHGYGSAGDVSDFIIDGNVVFENGVPTNTSYPNIFIGNTSGFYNPIVKNNLIYKRENGPNGGVGIQVGYGAGNFVDNAQVYDNFVADAAAFNFRDCTFSRFDGNTMYGVIIGDPLEPVGDNTQYESYPETGSNIFLTQNEYDSNRAHLTIYNWGLSDSIAIDVSTIYNNGDTINVHNTQDYFDDMQEVVVSGGEITVSMINRTVAMPVSWTAPQSTFPQFGCFVLEKN